jgi:hypothetical protein
MISIFVTVMFHDAEYREEVENSAKEIIEKKDEDRMKDKDSDFKSSSEDP